MVNTDQWISEIAWFRYLYCSKILKEQFESTLEMPETDFVYWRNPLGFVYMMYFYGSLYTLIEGWNELRLRDPVIDSIISHQTTLISLLRRCRNAAFHYQGDPMIAKYGEFLKTGEEHVIFTHQMHDEFERFYWDWVEKRSGTEQEKTELKESLRSLVGWFPRTLEDDERELASQLASIANDLLAHNISPDMRKMGIEVKRSCEVAIAECQKAAAALEEIRNRNLSILRADIRKIN